MAKTYTALTVANATAGNAILASDIAALFTNSNNWRVPPMWRLKTTGTQNALNGTDLLVTWDTSETAPAFDTDDVYAGATSATSITIQTTGVYLLTAQIDFQSNNSGRRSAFITRGGTAYSSAIVNVNELASSAGAHASVATGIVSLTAGDVLRVYAYQNSGGTLTIPGSGTAPETATTHFAGVMLGQLA